MQDNISLFRTQTRGPLLHRHEAVPLRRLVLRGDRNYLRALRAAEMAAWESARPSEPLPGVALKRHSRCCAAKWLSALLLLGALATPPALAAAHSPTDHWPVLWNQTEDFPGFA
jgi:hypothetical protein